MKHALQHLVETAITALREGGQLSLHSIPPVVIERSRDAQHGDFATPVALGLARSARTKPRDIAQAIVSHLPRSDWIEKVEIAGPGFINFFLSAETVRSALVEVLARGDEYGSSQVGGGEKVQVEFVSANPTGPLHVGHGRHAAFGSVVANLLATIGYNVHREYYINDAGRQMNILAVSVWLRYLELAGELIRFPDNGYRGSYVVDIARELQAKHPRSFVRSAARVLERLTPDESQGGDKEKHVDAMIARAKSLLGEAEYKIVYAHARDVMVAEIKDELGEFGVTFDEWYSEQSAVDSGAVARALNRLREAGCTYEKDGALWFASVRFGDEKDRVLVRENGVPTYFTNDIGYHLTKLDRGFDRLIDVWGADHHGHIPRMKSALAVLDDRADRLKVLLVQFASLYRGGKKVQMSTRAGEFITLRQLFAEVGVDAARFFYVMRKNDQHLDFDLDLAVSRSSENPVYYIQYAHARVCSVMRQLEEKGFAWSGKTDSLTRLTEEQEKSLVRDLDRFPEVVEAAALGCEPHQLAFYLREVANDFHTYYNAHTILVEDAGLRDARVALAQATRQVIANGLRILGVSAPESM